MLNNLMTRYLGQKKYRKILLQINSSYFSKVFLHNSRNKTRASFEPENLEVNKVYFAK